MEPTFARGAKEPPGRRGAPGPARVALAWSLLALLGTAAGWAAAEPAADDDMTADILDTSTPEDLIRLGEGSLERGDASDARELFEAALRQRPDDPQALLGLGRALTARRRQVEAEALYVDMENRGIAPIDARLGRARLRSLLGDHEGARRFYRDAMQAAPDNIEARLGMIREEHILGLDNQAIPQVDALVADHPESAEARRLQKRIHDDLRPSVALTPEVRHDDAGNRRTQVTATGRFMARPQTEVTVAIAGIDSTSECGGAIDCAVFVTPPTTAARVNTDTRSLTGGTIIRIARPLVFEARVGVMQEEPLDGGRRTFLFGDGVIRWDAGPRLALRGATERRALLDSAALVDRGIRLDTGSLRLEYRLHPLWFVHGTGELGRYSDGNAREGLETAITFNGTLSGPTVTTTAAVRLRRHHDDRDMGYLDPIRYDAETVTVTVAHDAWDGRFTWSVGGTYGRQSYDANEFETAAVAEEESPIAGGSARLGLEIGRAHLEAWHLRTNDALATAPGFPVRISGLTLKVRL